MTTGEEMAKCLTLPFRFIDISFPIKIPSCQRIWPRHYFVQEFSWTQKSITKHQIPHKP